MEISKETKKRIKAETEYASSVYASSFHPSVPPARKIDLDFAYNKGYEEGKTSEAERSSVLVEALQGFVDGYDCDSDAHKYGNVNACLVCYSRKVLNLYNNPDK